MIRVRAPGKVVLLGEYAVLDGAPAIVAAVNSGVMSTFTPGPALLIEAPDDRFVGPALSRAPTGTYTFQAWNPVITPGKAGLGSSAAATTAAVLIAQLARGASAEADYVFARAATVHHRVQGSGSGIDVAASTYGGVLHFLGGEITPVPIDLTDRLGVAFVGGPADTAPRIERYKAAVGRGDFVARSTAIVRDWIADPIRAFDDARENLRELDRRAGLGWWIEAYTPVIELAHRLGGAAKPSGAGGGDVVVAVFPDAAGRDAWLAAVPAVGAIALPVRVTGGVSVTP